MGGLFCVSAGACRELGGSVHCSSVWWVGVRWGMMRAQSEALALPSALWECVRGCLPPIPTSDTSCLHQCLNRVAWIEHARETRGGVAREGTKLDSQL